MTATFPPLPWNEGDTLVNNATNVTYVFNGKAWVSAGTPGDPQVDCLPVNNPHATGALTVSPVDWMEQSKFCVTNGTSAYLILKPSSTNTRSQVQYFGITEGDFDVATVGYVKSQLTSLGEEQEQTPSSFRKYKFANKGFLDLRPGEFCFIDAKNASTNELDLVRGVCFSAVDANGNRAVRDDTAISYRSSLGSALNLLNSDGSKLYYRVTTGAGLIDYDKELDLYMMFWNAGERTEKIGVRTSTFTKCTNGQSITFHCADLFF